MEAADVWSWTGLMLAVWDGHTVTGNALAGTYKANVEAVDGRGRTALMIAARNGHADTVNALRQCGA